MLSPWETPLKLSLYVIYTENKAQAKNHRECLFKHNSHGLWKMIKAHSLIVNIHMFRMSSFENGIPPPDVAQPVWSTTFRDRWWEMQQETTQSIKARVQVMCTEDLELFSFTELLTVFKCLEKERHFRLTRSNIHVLKVDFWSLRKKCCSAQTAWLSWFWILRISISQLSQPQK